MAEQIPEDWVDQEVTVFYGPEEHGQTGTLVSVSEQGLVVRGKPGKKDEGDFWHPLTSVIRLRHGGARRSTGTRLVR
jgi:hypothetical protein